MRRKSLSISERERERNKRNVCFFFIDFTCWAFSIATFLIYAFRYLFVFRKSFSMVCFLFGVSFFLLHTTHASVERCCSFRRSTLRRNFLLANEEKSVPQKICRVKRCYAFVHQNNKEFQIDRIFFSLFRVSEARRHNE